jgi:hypothetical protein
VVCAAQIGYAYILTHPSIPCIFYPHLFGDGSASGPSSGSLAPKIKVRWRRESGVNPFTARVFLVETVGKLVVVQACTGLGSASAGFGKAIKAA